MTCLTGTLAALVAEGWLTTESSALNAQTPIGFPDGALRGYQLDAVSAALTAPLGRGLVQVPTGGGKTRIGSAIMHAVGGTWLVIAPNQHLLRQFSAALESLGATFGMDPPEQVTWCTMGSLEALGSLRHRSAAPYDGVLVDEAHRVGARTYAAGLARVAALRWIGLTATPGMRSDDRNALVEGLLGPVVYRVTEERLRAEGHLAKGKVVLVL